MSPIEEMRAALEALEALLADPGEERIRWKTWGKARASVTSLRAAITQAEQQADQEQVLELAEALERRRILEVIKAVAAIHPVGNMPTAIQAAWNMACEEIFYRATECQWHMDEDAARFARGAGEV